MDKVDKFWIYKFILVIAVMTIAIYSMEVERNHSTRVTYVTPTPTAQQTLEPTPQPTPRQPIEIISLGEFRYTYYTNSIADCKKTDGITFSGTRAVENLTVAVDRNVIPLGSFLYLENIGFVVAQDIGSAVKGNIIDIYYEGEIGQQERGQVYLLGGD